jgi:DNA-binding response OmpR family regulator
MQHTKPRILIIDDDQDILEFLHIILEEEGYDVVTSDKDDFLTHLHPGGLPHLVVLDVLLSGKDGRQTVRWLKSQEETRTIPVLMFSAHPSAEETARQAGADDFLVKPFNIEAFLAKVAHFL